MMASELLNRRRWFTLLLCLALAMALAAAFVLTVALLSLLSVSVLVMSSENYRLDWFTPLTGSRGPVSSASYAVNLTVGQTTIGVSASDSHRACLGY